MASVEELLRSSTLYRNLSAEDQRRLAQVSLARTYEKGETIFAEGDPPDYLVTIAAGRVKVVKMIPSGPATPSGPWSPTRAGPTRHPPSRSSARRASW
jgi:hypothetical protein